MFLASRCKSRQIIEQRFNRWYNRSISVSLRSRTSFRPERDQGPVSYSCGTPIDFPCAGFLVPLKISKTATSENTKSSCIPLNSMHDVTMYLTGDLLTPACDVIAFCIYIEVSHQFKKKFVT